MRHSAAWTILYRTLVWRNWNKRSCTIPEALSWHPNTSFCTMSIYQTSRSRSLSREGLSTKCSLALSPVKTCAGLTSQTLYSTTVAVTMTRQNSQKQPTGHCAYMRLWTMPMFSSTPSMPQRVACHVSLTLTTLNKIDFNKGTAIFFC